MTNAPSPQPPEIAAEAEKKPLKPGKRYGIAAMGCGLVPLLFMLLCAILEPLDILFHQSPWNEISCIFGVGCMICLCITPFLVIKGQKTQGKRYANIGLLFILLFCLYLLFSICFGFYWIFILGNPH